MAGNKANGCDFLVIGGGIAGASAAYELAEHGEVIVLERESQPGYHSTGRSAAIYTETYGNATIRAITTGGRSFLADPPDCFGDNPLMSPRGALFIGRADQTKGLDDHFTETSRLVDSVRRLDAKDVLEIVPVLREDYIAGGVYEPDATDLDVAALHQGFLRGMRERGGRIVTDAEVRVMARTGKIWDVETPAGRFTAPVVVNAAGAWCDVVASMAGAAPVGLVPKRRTAFTFDPPADVVVDGWPLTVDADEEFYFKPEAGRLLGSPADETPIEPCDVQPEELDIAVAADRIEKATRLTVPRILSQWAGLRSFVADKTPVVGFDPNVEGLFWLAGQGGYGIQTSPSMARIAAGLVTGTSLPDDLGALGVTEAALSPARFREA